MNIAENITELIGNTPLVRLNRLNGKGYADILVKLEFFNPLSSIKDRVAFSIIRDAEKKGIIDSGSTLIEATSGNTGLGLAFVSAQRGYRLIIVMPESMSEERKKLMRILGAELVLTPAEQGMKGAIEKASELKESIPGSFMTDQFRNPANPRIHRQTTAVEIWEATGGNMDIFIAGVGTGGTLTGVGEFLKSRKKELSIIAVEPENSAVLSGGKPGSHRIQGIGAGFLPEILNRKIIDRIIKVDYDKAVRIMERLAAEEGILAGISAGANISAALGESARPENRGKRIVTVAPDTGERYLSILR